MRWRLTAALAVLLALMTAWASEAQAPSARPTALAHSGTYTAATWAEATPLERTAYVAGVVDAMAAVVYEATAATEWLDTPEASMLAVYRASRALLAVRSYTVEQLAELVRYAAPQFPAGTSAALAVWDVAGRLADRQDP